VRVQEIRWVRGGTEHAGEYTCSYGKGNENRELGTGLFVHRRIISAVNRAEFVSDRMSCVIVRGLWGDIVVLNVHAPTEDKIDDVKDSFYEDLERVFDKFAKFHSKFRVVNFVTPKNLIAKIITLGITGFLDYVHRLVFYKN
jgi:hypothetical protein